MDIGEHLVGRLGAYGVRQIFGCPGGQTLPLYHALADPQAGIGHVLMHDERSAAYAADAYARATGRVGVCDATVGPGATNLVSGLAEALSSSIPVLAIVSDIPRAWEHRRHLGSASQAFEQRGFLERCVKYYGRAESPEMLDETLHRCLSVSVSGRPGPAVLEIPADVFAGAALDPAFPVQSDWDRTPRPGADAEAISRCVAHVRACRHPMIIAGGGAVLADAADAVEMLADALLCPIATTLSGKGLIPETDPRVVGVAGRFGVPLANDLVAQSDCVIFVGCKAGQSTTLDWTTPPLDAVVIHIDIDPLELGRNYHRTLGVAADAAVGAAAIAREVSSQASNSSWDWDVIAAMKADWWDGPIPFRAEPVPGVVKPQEVMRAISRLVGDEAAIVADASLSSGWAGTRIQLKAPGRRFFAPRGLAGLGWGLPAAIGVSVGLAGTRGPTICIAGDGAWAYSMAEVETATRLGVPIISVILNNSSLAWIKHSAGARYVGRVVSTEFLSVDYALAAQALGANARRVESLSDFEDALSQALRRDGEGPWVIDVRSCDIESPVVTATPGVIRAGY